ncbi:hypothetical protein BMJ32_18205 [Sinorhizobium medicae]|nr:hypothetical protein BMJ32_18205 [Sinorhizobium medicae]PLU58379.1 hypothetical protein BMJ23_06050 [Sinorhizobium medicae]PLU72867.1 hypothetical protein BMJ21_07325 [Sinorhizobium medicae]PLU83769.1 hypothetical protein BMJ22_02135 [Sinorhizobium medicae]
MLTRMLQGPRVDKCLKVKVTVTSSLPYLRPVALDPKLEPDTTQSRRRMAQKAWFETCDDLPVPQ